MWPNVTYHDQDKEAAAVPSTTAPAQAPSDAATLTSSSAAADDKQHLKVTNRPNKKEEKTLQEVF